MMDKTTLENTIKHECEEALATIREDEAEQIRRLNMQCQAAIDSIRKVTADDTDDQIRHEMIRLENKAGLERQKIRLQSIEAFVGRVVDGVMAGMQKHPRYRPFLLTAVENAVKDIPGRAEVRLSANDLDLEKDIRKVSGGNSVSVIADPSNRFGGCLVVDEEGGRIFNSSLERIYYRKSGAVRRMVARILGETPEDAAKEVKT